MPLDNLAAEVEHTSVVCIPHLSVKFGMIMELLHGHGKNQMSNCQKYISMY